MKKRTGVIFMAIMAVFLMLSAAKDKGTEIKFNHVTLEEAKVMAKESGKLIFIDCYTDWCGPCRRMAATSFKDEKVANMFNKNFINLKVEMEKNPDGRNIARQYKINAYPTLLFINSEGKLVKKAIGLHKSNHLIQLANNVLDK